MKKPKRSINTLRTLQHIIIYFADVVNNDPITYNGRLKNDYLWALNEILEVLKEQEEGVTNEDC